MTRFVALDLHRTYLVVGAVDGHQNIVLTPRRFGFEVFWAWAWRTLVSIRCGRLGSKHERLGDV